MTLYQNSSQNCLFLQTQNVLPKFSQLLDNLKQMLSTLLEKQIKMSSKNFNYTSLTMLWRRNFNIFFSLSLFKQETIQWFSFVPRQYKIVLFFKYAASPLSMEKSFGSNMFQYIFFFIQQQQQQQQIQLETRQVKTIISRS